MPPSLYSSLSHISLLTLLCSFFLCFLCRNTVFNLSIHDLAEQQRLVWTSPEDDTKMCLVKGKDEVSAKDESKLC